MKGSLLGFFVKVFGDNPELVAGWKKVIKKQDRKTRKLLNRAIKTELETLLSETETGAALNDMYWGAFFASGDLQYVAVLKEQREKGIWVSRP